MSKINKTLRYVIRKTRWPWVKLSLFIKNRMGWLGVPVIYPYYGFSNGKHVFLSGSVIEDRGLSKPHEGQSIRSNILAMIKRYVGDEFAGVRVKIEFAGQVHEVETNRQGYFSCSFRLEQDIESVTGWKSAHFVLIDRIHENQPEVTASGDVLMIGNKPQFLIISDVDDTLIVSHSTQTLRKIRLMLFKNAMTRVPFPGVSAFYNALQKGENGNAFNPVFYVSSSERNLYDLLVEFCIYRNIPKGPFLLREMQTSLQKLITAGGGDHLHKLRKIRTLMNIFPGIPVIMIGDSGQRDPEIYMQIVREFPGRVKSIYIRSIGSKSKIEKAAGIAKECSRLNTEMLLVKSTHEASKHAIENGFIEAGSLQEIRQESARDREE